MINPTQSRAPLIRIENLTKMFGKQESQAMSLIERGCTKSEILERTGVNVGVYGVSLTIQHGEQFVLMGLSGSGKSTLLRCINRLITPTIGSVFLDNDNITAMTEAELLQMRQKRMSMVFQQFALFPHRTVRDNVAYGLEVQGMERHQRLEIADRMLDMVGLRQWGDQYPSSLSGGMQQRVGLARGLAPNPDILLMDEAFSALDPLIREEMQDELLNLQASLHKTVIFVTHDLNEALKLGQHIALMRDGQVVQIGTPEEIINHPSDEYVARFVRGVDRTKVLTAGDIMTAVNQVDFDPGETVTRDCPMDELIRCIAKSRRPVVVVADGQCCGVVTQDAILAAIANG